MQDSSLSARERLRARLPGLLILGVVAALGMVAAGILAARKGGAVVRLDALTLASVEVGAIGASILAVGTLRSAREQWVVAPSDGYIASIDVSPGSRVEANGVLIRLSSDEVERDRQLAQLALADSRTQLVVRQIELEKEMLVATGKIVEAKAAHERALAEHTAYSALASTGIVSRLDAARALVQERSARELLESARQAQDVLRRLTEGQLSAIRSEVETREPILRLAEAKADSLTVRAPYAATVLSMKTADHTVGSRVAAGDRLLRLVDPSSVQAELRVSSDAIAKINVGSPAVVTIFDGQYAGAVVAVDPTVVDQYVTVTVGISEKLPVNAATGLQVEGAVELGSRMEGLLLRASRTMLDTALNSQSVYVVSDDGESLSRVRVRFGARSRDAMVVESGLNAGDRVVVGGLAPDESRTQISLR